MKQHVISLSFSPRTLPLLYVCPLLVIIVVTMIGCNDKSGEPTTPVATTSATDGHAALHKTKYNEVLVEFPGHKFAMEIIDEKETTGKVTAFLTDAHFEPVEVDTKEVQLNFIIGGSPKTFTLTRLPHESGEPATFSLMDSELATLNCEGWAGVATASMEASGVPYSAALVKLGTHDHDHGH